MKDKRVNMQKLVPFFVSLGLLASPLVHSNEDINISGFGSIIGGFVLEGDGYWARQPYAAGQYADGFEVKSESRVGIQARYFLTDKTRITGQVMMRGVHDFDPELEWLYVSHDITYDLSIHVGQMRLPVYHYSDYMDVGIAYPWLRVPSDAYSLAVTNFQGAGLQYNFNFDSGWTGVKIYAGQQDTDPNELITTISQYQSSQLYDKQGEFWGVKGIRRVKHYRDMKGIVLETNINWFGARVSYLEQKEQFLRFDEGQYPSNTSSSGRWYHTHFADVSFTIDTDKWFAIYEWNKYEGLYKSWLASIAYRVGKFTPYVYYTEFREVDSRDIAPGGISAGFEDRETGTLDVDYNTLAFGSRYDINPRLALKAEYTIFSDNGDAAVFIDENQDGVTDSKGIFVGLDFKF